MSRNRTILYGYRKVGGVFECDEFEREIVVEIYTKYSSGNSYKVIAENLSTRQVPYTADKKVWNKNMVARILQNSAYLGDENYPQIISHQQKISSDQAVKSYTITITNFLKSCKKYYVCAECGGKILRKKNHKINERWYCENDLNHISAKITDLDMERNALEFFQSTLPSYQLNQSPTNLHNIEIIRLQNEIEQELAEENILVKELQLKIQLLAEMKFQTLENTIHLRQKALTELIENPIKNIDNLKEIVVNLRIGKCGTHTPTYRERSFDEASNNNTRNG